MSVITWRNVDAPDFSTALKGVETANNLFNKAIDSGQSLVNGVQGMQTDAANRAILARQMAMQDPTAYQEAVANGTIVGPDAQHASIDTLRGVDSRIGTLADQAQRAEQARQTLWQNGRTRTGTAAEDAWTPYDAAYRQAIAQNDGSPEARAKIAEFENRPEFKAMYLKSQQNVSSNALDAGEAVYNLNNTQTSQAESKLADESVAKILKASVVPEVRAQMAQGMGLPDRVLKRVMAGIGLPEYDANLLGGTGMAVGGGDGFTAAGSSPFISSIPASETQNYVTKITGAVGAVTGKTSAEKADQILPHLIQAESSGNPNALGPVNSKGRRAVGLMQLDPPTARALEAQLGMKPNETDTNPEANRRAGREYLIQMLDKYDGNVEHALAAYNAGPGTVDGWFADNKVNPQTSEYVSTGIGAAAGQQAAASPLAANYNKLLGESTADPFQAIKQAQDADYIPKDLSPEDKATLKDTLVEYQRRGTANGTVRPANITLAMLLDASRAQNNLNLFDSELGNALEVDDEKFDTTAELERTGGLLKNSVALNATVKSKAAVDQARADFQKAQQELMAVQDLQDRVGGHEADVAAKQAQVNRMQARMAGVTTNEAGKPGNQPATEVTEPTPIAPVAVGFAPQKTVTNNPGVVATPDQVKAKLVRDAQRRAQEKLDAAAKGDRLAASREAARKEMERNRSRTPN